MSHSNVMFSPSLDFGFLDKHEGLGLLMGFFESFSLDCSCDMVFVCLIHGIELHAMNTFILFIIKKSTMTSL